MSKSNATTPAGENPVDHSASNALREVRSILERIADTGNDGAILPAKARACERARVKRGTLEAQAKAASKIVDFLFYFEQELAKDGINPADL